MKIAIMFDHLDIGHIAIPEYQRGYAWNRDEMQRLFGSLYR